MISCVAVAPVIVGPPQPVDGLIGGTAVLFCNATGSPRPNVEWINERNTKVRTEILFTNISKICWNKTEILLYCRLRLVYTVIGFLSHFILLLG